MNFSQHDTAVVSLCLLVVPCVHRKYTFIWNRGFCLQGTFVLYCRCAPVHFWKSFFYMCDWTLHCSIICDTIYVYIIRRWTCFSHVVCTIGFYMMSIIFIERALLELDILCASVLYFYVMSWHSPTTCSPGTLYWCMSCSIFLYDVSGIYILRAVQELDILCPTVLYISTWCHWY